MVASAALFLCWLVFLGWTLKSVSLSCCESNCCSLADWEALILCWLVFLGGTLKMVSLPDFAVIQYCVLADGQTLFLWWLGFLG